MGRVLSGEKGLGGGVTCDYIFAKKRLSNQWPVMLRGGPRLFSAVVEEEKCIQGTNMILCSYATDLRLSRGGNSWEKLGN